jgi:SAM-dependent methyltransferase
MGTPDDAKAKAAATYNAAADFYDDPANSFWDRFGRKTIERLRLPLGARVLDACCGAGASALPAAETVGPQGFVLGIDLAENLLTLARAKASARGLKNIEFRVADVLDLGLLESQFDAVVCVFGIFFIPDMPAAVRALWRVVRPEADSPLPRGGRTSSNRDRRRSGMRFARLARPLQGLQPVGSHFRPAIGTRATACGRGRPSGGGCRIGHASRSVTRSLVVRSSRLGL